MEVGMKFCSSQPRSEKLVVWGNCQRKWRENCQKGSEVYGKINRLTNCRKCPFFFLKVKHHPSRGKTGN